jgi:hypothetical protein
LFAVDVKETLLFFENDFPSKPDQYFQRAMGGKWKRKSERKRDSSLVCHRSFDEKVWRPIIMLTIKEIKLP